MKKLAWLLVVACAVALLMAAIPSLIDHIWLYVSDSVMLLFDSNDDLLTVAMTFLVSALFSALAVWLVRRLSMAQALGNYVSDDLDGVFWEWSYGDGAEIRSLRPSCLKCRTPLSFLHVGMAYGGTQHEPASLLRCETCRRYVAKMPGWRHEIYRRVRQEIADNIRSGRWKRSSSPGG